jgi:hypothetical protein
MPAVFSKKGVRFTFPDNWTLDERDAGDARTVSVASPDGAFWWLAIHPRGDDVAEAARAVLDGLRGSYDNLDAEAVVEVIADQETVGYDVNFFCLDLTSTARIRGFETHEAAYIMLWQAEDREFAEVEPVFQAITASLINTACE